MEGTRIARAGSAWTLLPSLVAALAACGAPSYDPSDDPCNGPLRPDQGETLEFGSLTFSIPSLPDCKGSATVAPDYEASALEPSTCVEIRSVEVTIPYSNGFPWQIEVRGPWGSRGKSEPVVDVPLGEEYSGTRTYTVNLVVRGQAEWRLAGEWSVVVLSRFGNSTDGTDMSARAKVEFVYLRPSGS